ncbi:hypothetical protein G7Y79_00014g037220 [Physcia stellaris]|nr:hypothetical protein G7Y79_00014g037220 [Physcia stellaris]
MADKRPFAVYRTVDVDIDAIVDRLGKGMTGKCVPEENELDDLRSHPLPPTPEESHHDLYHAHPTPLLSLTPSQVIAQHRTLTHLTQSLLLIADRTDLPTHGLLIINLTFANRPDAQRQKLYYATGFVPSINIGEVSWSETLANATLPLYPRKQFALFADPGFQPGI